MLLTRQFHDAVPSSIRAGVSSGVGTLTWMAFLPFAVGFGFLSRHAGVLTAGWMVVAVTAATCASLAHLALSRSSAAVASAVGGNGTLETGSCVALVAC